jgi:hypothetical protein
VVVAEVVDMDLHLQQDHLILVVTLVDLVVDVDLLMVERL